MLQEIKACIFDLDGVIVDTAKYHYNAWKRLANELGFDFSEEDNEKLKGVGRTDSLNLILGWGGKEVDEKAKVELAARKNEWYVESIQKMDENEILPGIVELISELEESKIKVVLGSASKNAPAILRQVKLYDRFDAIIDGSQTVNGKPHPEVFLKGANAVNIDPQHCIVFEDAGKGVDAALAGGMYAVGIGQEASLGHAHLVISSFEGRKLKDITSGIAEKMQTR